jgi:hypothetical protein
MPSENTNLIIDDNFVEFIVELWRLPKMFNKLIGKMDLDEQKRYNSQFAWFNKKAIEFIQNKGIVISAPEGMPFDVGMPVTPLNIADFDKNDELIIDQVIEPVIMHNEKILKTGTVTLKKEIK